MGEFIMDSGRVFWPWSMEAADSTKDRPSWGHRASEPGRHLLWISFALVAPWAWTDNRDQWDWRSVSG